MKNSLFNLLNLHRGEQDKRQTLTNVVSNISFKGSNLWILACAIIVASIGLNINSTAVIIGAMLISPLMGPIVGAGFALGIYDFDLLKKSLSNLLIATVSSLIVSSLYFLLSPFKEAQSELLARTSPNIYDVLIAFFGGLVGVIAITRVEKGNPIPGVAIATALMPPLCTAGYGLATGNIKYFFGALFLYSINCVFICISTFVIVKYLKYPAATQVDKKYQKRVQYGITALLVLMIVPSVYFAFSLYQQQKFIQNTNDFITKEFVNNGDILVFKQTDYSSNPKKITLAFWQKNYSPAEVKTLSQKLESYGLSNTQLFIKQNDSTNIQSLRNDILNEVGKNKIILDDKDKQIAKLESIIAKNNFDNKQLLSEAKILFPGINALAVSNQNIAVADSTQNITMVYYNATSLLKNDDKIKFKDWAKKRLNIDTLVLSSTDK
ncbi:TIGR00341 family protein [Arachidicoccus ginsenosidimutans]|uniref:TIGR00341 family protein n=1 Tax=Arachidicoccus sp. BS20 TaxID=1850526 RepID=UPI0007F11575|nr:TIGR00341 family protein [Arachidicoccus sp. BS20]ANI89143.1 TIGR00341 family protein [Arachidicoccus sp. BS20]